MAVLGICVVPGGGAPKLHGVIADGTFEDPIIVDSFEVRTNSHEASEQAVDLARLLLAKLPGLRFSAAAIRIAGTTPVPRRNKAAFSRAHAEGAALYVLREHLKSPVATGDPKALAKSSDVPYPELEATAKGLLKSKADATLAALSQLPKS
ncbi:hypothetical protein [Rhodococcus sp. LW-XY12]|uniref:hypothetical protein n=1 Tax=Rhodococcus sp. LW-XY12 TaxID=2856851 RepID=UPI001C55F4D1|nr:hypothetical protein [Rhodococcus sp. LW-XY12]QXU56573.1 hypothetical protein KXC42_25965 [Rhodococcus sp. LW-XY12]